MKTIGILGLGEGRSTISAALQSDKLRLAMICDQNLDLCRQRCDEGKVYDYTTKYEDILNDAGIDIMAMYSHDHLHDGHGKEGVIHGKHVVCTIPSIDDLGTATELVEL